jgi:hypothetical protein
MEQNVNNENNNEERQINGSSAVGYDHQQEQLKKIFNEWSDLIKLPTIGPFHAFSKDFVFYTKVFFNIGQTLIQLQIDLKDYWTQMNNAYVKAMNEIAERAPVKRYNFNDNNYNNAKTDLESYRNIAIDAFENAFTELFGSKEFGSTYAKVLDSQLALSKNLQNIAENNSKIFNLPTRSEVDEIIKDIHDLKKTIRDMKRDLDRNSYR